MNQLAPLPVFVNKNHELAWHCADAGIPVAAHLPDKSSEDEEKEATTDKNEINEWWRTNPSAHPMIFGLSVVTVGPKASLPSPLPPTLHYTYKDEYGRSFTIYFYKRDDRISDGHNLIHNSLPVELWESEDEYKDKEDEISVGNSSWSVLSEDTAGPFVIAPLPEWVVDRLWGEEFRGTKLDLPDDVAAAKELLQKAEPPADIVCLVPVPGRPNAWTHRRPRPRPTEQEVRDAEETLEIYDDDALRDVIELAKAPRERGQLFAMCYRVFALGISEARARVLLDLYWNERGNPPYPAEQLAGTITDVWHPDQPEWPDGDYDFCITLSDIPPRLRWRYRETDWLMEESEPEDLLLGEVISTTTRAMLYAPTGTGKTLFALDLATYVAAGSGFLHWKGSEKPRRVLYIDGEMSRALMRARFQEAVRRLGKRPVGLVVLNREQTPELPSLDTADGQRWLNRYVEDRGPFDLIVFDNIASLLGGSMIGVESWNATKPWVRDLSARGIAQIWVHHTGIDTSHAYGDSTREFEMDTVIKLDPAGDGIKLSFPKARRRMPANLADFEPVQIRLTDGQWRCHGAGEGRVAAIEKALLAAGIIGDDKAISHAELAALLADQETNAATWRQRVKDASRCQPYQHLLVAMRKGLHWRVGG
jgi:hypothetical protein